MIGSRRASGLKAVLALTVGVATLAASAWTAAGMSWPDMRFAPGLAAVHEARANAALAAGGDLAVAERESLAAVSMAPANASSWARLAYVESRRSSSVTEKAAHSLEMSYLVAPLGPDISRWRIRFMLDNWPHLASPLKQKALQELRTFAHYHAGSADLAAQTRDPVARLAATMTIRLGYGDARREHTTVRESSFSGR